MSTLSSRALLACLSSVLLVSLPEAQGQRSLRVEPVSKEVNRVVARRVPDESGVPRWDYRRVGNDWGDLGSTPAGRHKALVNAFENTVTTGFFAGGTIGSEWLDWALKDSGGTGVVGAFAFRYATQNSSAALSVSFYSGTTGFCTRGQRVSDLFQFTGLPGSVGTSTTMAFSLTAFLDSNQVFCLPDGKIGWSYTFDQDRTGPLLAGNATNTCWVDAYDLWHSPDAVSSCAGTFFFGGCVPPTAFLVPPPCAGFWIKVFEQAAVPGVSATFNNAMGIPNPMRYSEVQSAALGKDWITNIVIDPGNGEVAGVLRFGLPGLKVPNGVPIPGLLVNQSRLVMAGTGVNLSVPGVGTTMVSTIGIPKNLELLGMTFVTQGFGCILAPVRFQALNGLEITVGVD